MATRGKNNSARGKIRHKVATVEKKYMATGNYFLILTRTHIGYGVKKSDRQQKEMMPDGGMKKKKDSYISNKPDEGSSLVIS